jgi:hypothetical protein
MTRIDSKENSVVAVYPQHSDAENERNAGNDVRHRRCACWSSNSICLGLEHAAYRAAVVAQGT